MIDLMGLDKADVLCALYNQAKTQGLGAFHYRKESLSHDAAAALLKEHRSFDYLRGRVLKVDLGSNTMDPYLYDRDNGEGAAARAISTLTRVPHEG